MRRLLMFWVCLHTSALAQTSDDCSATLPSADLPAGRAFKLEGGSGGSDSGAAPMSEGGSGHAVSIFLRHTRQTYR